MTRQPTAGGEAGALSDPIESKAAHIRFIDFRDANRCPLHWKML